MFFNEPTYSYVGFFMSKIQIDIVSDVVCPWCAIGYGNLQQALDELTDLDVAVEWHPFQLNPHMGPEGEDINEHLANKYGLTEQQLAENKGRIQEMGQLAGIDINFDARSRIYNTFQCHMLLDWAKEQGKQTALKLALFDAYFTQGLDVANVDTLKQICESIGLNVDQVDFVLADSERKAKVESEEEHFKSLGIQSVPAFILNQKYLISGGQPKQQFIEALTEIANKEAS